MTPRFENLDCIKFDDPRNVRCWYLWTTTVWDFHVEQPHIPSFLFRRGNGDVIQIPDNNGTTDFCSTPPFMWGIPGFNPTRFKFSGTVHDQAYQHHWLWINGAKVWIEREYADTLLEEMIESEPDPGNWFEGESYKMGVRLGGRWCWGKGDSYDPPAKLNLGKILPFVA